MGYEQARPLLSYYVRGLICTASRNIKSENYYLKKENKLFSKQIEGQLNDIKQLKSDLSDQFCQLKDSQNIVDKQELELE